MSLLGTIFSLGAMVLGGVIGSMIPGVGTSVGIALGAAIGGALGGYIGNVLFPDKVNPNSPPPPKPHENRVQISTYGKSIPIVYESSRLSGNIIYMQPVQITLVQSKHRDNGIRYFEYTKTYTSTFAIAFCEGPVSGISRIWVNNDIFADYRDPAGEFYPAGSTALASANLATSIAREEVYFTIYTGTEIQDSDPSISAILGATETPAYRGIVYIVFKDFPVGEFTGIPQIEVEIGPQMQADPCSHYFDGTGTGLDTDFWTGPQSNIDAYARQNGVAILQHVEPMPDWETTGDVQTVFTYDGDFDVQIDWAISNLSANTGGWIDFFPTDSNGWIGLYFGNQATGNGVDYWSDGDGGYDSYLTTDRSGKFRVTRISGTIRGYVWNESSSQWEWNGDTNGVVLVTGYTDSCTMFLETYVTINSDPNESAVISIDNYITNSGCSETTWPT